MTRHLIIFAVTFAVGALVAVILRTASHKPYEVHAGHPAPGAASAAPATAYGAADLHAGHADAAAPAADPHQGHEGTGAPTPAAAPDGLPGMALPAPAKPADPAAAPDPSAGTAAVNTICAICGMPVNPKLGTIPYKGKLIGFGCKACPPKFKADPAQYGEAALLNQVVE